MPAGLCKSLKSNEEQSLKHCLDLSSNAQDGSVQDGVVHVLHCQDNSVHQEFYFLHMEGASPSRVTWHHKSLWVSPKLLLSLKVKARKAPCLVGDICTAQTEEVLLVFKSLETGSSCESMFESRICSTVISRAHKRFSRALKRKSDLIKRA